MPTDHGPQCQTSVVLEHLWGCGLPCSLCNCVIPVPMHHHSFREEILPNIQPQMKGIMRGAGEHMVISFSSLHPLKAPSSFGTQSKLKFPFEIYSNRSTSVSLQLFFECPFQSKTAHDSVILNYCSYNKMKADQCSPLLLLCLTWHRVKSPASFTVQIFVRLSQPMLKLQLHQKLQNLRTTPPFIFHRNCYSPPSACLQHRTVCWRGVSEYPFATTDLISAL